MKVIKSKLPLVTGVLLLVPNIAYAEIEGFAFASAMQEQSLITAANGSALNPKLSQPMNVFISAGLDRKIRLYWLSNGVKINEVTTGIIGVSDRISSFGKDFYGKTISIKAPSLDGSYTLKSELLSADGTIVGGWSMSIVIDTVGPNADASNISYSMTAYGGSVSSYSPANFGSLKLSNITDGGSGLASAKYIVKSDSTGIDISSLAAQANILDSSVFTSSLPASLFPEQRNWYRAGFRVYDAAGNYNDVTARSFIDKGGYTSPVLSDIWNPTTSTWMPYNPGMLVGNNPIKVRYRMLFRETKTANGDWGWLSYHYREGDYVYLDHTLTYPMAEGYWVSQTPSGYYTVSYFSGFNVTLADGVDRNPIKQAQTVEWFAEDGSTGGSSISVASRTTIVRIRLHSEAMKYEQLAILHSFGSCVIPIGQTFCDLSISHVFSSGVGYAPYTYEVKSSVNGVVDGRFSAHFTYWYTYWDFIPPTIESIEVTGDTVIASVYDTNTTSDWRKGMWFTNVFRLKSSFGVELEPESWVTTDTGKHRAVFKLNKLPSGMQNISFYAQDSYGNRTEKTVVPNYLNDTTPPVLKLQSPTGAPIINGSEINGLESLRIKMTDDSPATIITVVLSGGAANDTVFVSTNELGGGLYDLNYPRLFPSLEANETYTITAKAADSAGNASTIKSSFLYLPPNLLRVGNLNTLAVNKQLQSSDGKPISFISTGVLRTSQGQLAAGPQQAFITLRSDAGIAVNLLQTTLMPGETKEVTITPDIHGEVMIPVYSASAGIKGTASFMIDIPQITSNN